MHRVPVVAAILLLAFAPLSAEAENRVGRLQPGDRTGAGGLYYDLLAIEGTAGKTLEVSVLSPDFKPVVMLYTPNKQPVGQSTGVAVDGGYKLSAGFPLAEGGTWYLLVGQTPQPAEGTYVLDYELR